ncbi:ESSS subunit of NADH:ubiquinone oxidoreductase-domain-containing protein [Lentinula novae-zelandiae]|uniref:NADH dehydrogenase [ubiquinone] 1 beta subcomplex subunit 11, mitochondrial n=1 Tax=Lentinula lateritia TaxID=40482 RepID=A0ABQ8VAA9_9AGAR|nr:ESSS subunit of NADH:ubiquinone oxidoreductase-domain-containing protein [Lentinula novae-zelandiae]KAJ4484055.1 ESSS subunit of NADH:ubiquinone oxidoreductase-domain-containing protein [Lentinula lateritia]
MLQSSQTVRLARLGAQLGGRRLASHGAPQFNEPSGYLFGEKPLAPGQKRVKESWENIWYIGMFGSMAFAAVMLYYKPDNGVESWALREAKERMEARGEKYKYEPESSSSSSSS